MFNVLTISKSHAAFKISWIREKSHLTCNLDPTLASKSCWVMDTNNLKANLKIDQTTFCMQAVTETRIIFKSIYS